MTMLQDKDLNLDPITDEPGAHPVGTGVGAAGGAAAGAAAGALAGPVGAAIGLVAGAVVGGLAGKATAEGINPTDEAAYWREQYMFEPYYRSGRSYGDYAPAFEQGWNLPSRHRGEFELFESQLAAQWSQQRGTSSLSWDEARPAARSAWARASQRQVAQPGSELADSMETVDTLNDLLATCNDGEMGFTEASENTKSGSLQQLFLRRASECRAAATELHQQIARLGGKAADGGTASGKLHRGWMQVRGTLGGLSDLALLNECERGEDAAVARYRKALKQGLSTDVQELVERQAAGAQRNHDQIKSLRDMERNSA